MTGNKRHISLLVMAAFLAMIIDLAGLYRSPAADHQPEAVTGCHGQEQPVDWGHNQSCTPKGVQPCHLCAILIDLPLMPSAPEFGPFGASLHTGLTDIAPGTDPDPPKPAFA